MADSRKFKFVSPGIFIDEIDQSQVPVAPENVGPVIIGRAERGPSMVPVKINSFSEFVETFGNPIAGKGGSDDVWRDGNFSAPTYGVYAAQAYLKAGVGPVTFVRLLGTDHPDATADGAGEAGWKTAATPNKLVASNGGAYGLFVWPSSSNGGEIGSHANPTGSLAAVWYLDTGSKIELTGTVDIDKTKNSQSAGQFYYSDASKTFTAVITKGSAVEERVTFSLDISADNYIRNVFNTNPQLVNSTIEDTNLTKSYWLGETYERTTSDTIGSSTVQFGALAAVMSGSAANHKKKMGYRDAHSGWFFSQDVSTDNSSYKHDDMTKLFKFVGINGYGEWLNKNVKISVSNVRASNNTADPYSKFDILIRRASDSDLKPIILERYSGLTLNPLSQDYIATRIGDMSIEWDNDENRYREFGDFLNRSRYVRVVMNDVAIAPALAPFGVYGPPRCKSYTFASGNANMFDIVDTLSSATWNQIYSFTTTTGSIPGTAIGHTSNDLFEVTGNSLVGFTGSVRFPASPTRASASNGGTTHRNAYFGTDAGRSSANTDFDPGYGEYLRPFSDDIISDNSWSDTFGLGSLPNAMEYGWVFSLDDLRVVTGSSYSFATGPANNINDVYWISGSRVAGSAFNCSGTWTGAASWQNILKADSTRFTSPMWGGFDALDIKEREPFRDSLLNGSESETGNYAYFTVKRAINTVADPEVVETNMISMPGLTNESLTKHLIDVCEARGDAIGVIDAKGGFTPRHDSSDTASSRKGDLKTVLDNMDARNLNNSYGATYYPWVKIRDDINGVFLNTPPSVVAIGTLAHTEKVSDVWFAPAGFQRGGLSNGNAGLTVVGIETKLTSKNRDDLYERNINPIASFPAQGIVVFGQKTLQATPSALDRINVRRMLIHVKRGISRIATTTLFSPNVQATWTGFKTNADNFLQDVKSGFGIDDFRVILDETTTTPDLVDRNIIYAKVFVKPTKAAEFIAIDFIITRSGASFED
jgi:phage tail sheath protein FI